MKMDKLFAFFLFVFFSIASFLLGPQKTYADPLPGRCDATTCHAVVLNNYSDDSPGSLENAIKGACLTNQDDLISFQPGFFIREPVIRLSRPLMIPSNCRGKIEIAGPSDVEVVINGSDLMAGSTTVSEPATSGSANLCALYVNSNNNKIHHLTFGNSPFGVCVYGEGNQVSDSSIGLRRDGSALPNQVGVYVAGSGSLILNNVIASNASHGIVVKGLRNLIQQNYIGTSPLDIGRPRGNGGSGIRLISGATQNLIGGDLVLNANFIRYNGAGGVVLEAGASLANKISHNRFAGNAGLAIDLKANGVSLPTTGETGPNNMIPMPTEVQVIPLRRAAPYDSFVFRGRAPENYFIEVYLVDSGDDADVGQRLGGQSYGEGEYFLTSQRVNATRDGKFSVTITSSLLDLHKKVSAILRDAAGNTSEFSGAIELLDRPNPQNPDCGNGQINASESCDDGNTNPGDGCSAICSVEPGFRCSGSPSRCEPEVPLCGNGVVDAGEECDDNNRGADDGCAGDCTEESGWTCTRELGMRSVCTRDRMPPGGDRPQTPTGLTAEPTGPRSVNVSFDDNSTDETGFRVDRAEGPCGAGRAEADFTVHFSLPAHAGTGRVTYADTTVLPEHTYCYRAVSVRDGVSSDPSNQDDATTPREGSAMGMNPPSSLHADPDGPNRVRVTFTDNSSDETGFEIERADGPCSAGSVFTRLATVPPAAGTGSSITYNDDTAQPAHTYCYRARAINPGGASDYSNTDDATTPGVSNSCGNGRRDAGESCDDADRESGDGCSDACRVETGWTCNDASPSVCSRTPTGPTGLTATPTGPTQVRVTFTDNNDNETGFAIDRADGECRADSVFTQIGTAPALEGTGGTVIVIDNTVQPGKTYCYRARGILPTGPTAPSNAATATTPNPGVTPPPGGLTDSLQGSGCSLQADVEGAWKSSALSAAFLSGLLLLALRKRRSL